MKDITLTNAFKFASTEKIYIITNADDLSFIPENRSLKGENVDSIVNAFKQKEWIAPIYITKEGKIVDGQHRLTAFRIVKSENPYENYSLRVVIINSEESPIQLAIKFNAYRANWTTKDYMQCYLKQAYPSYVALNTFLQLYPLFDIKSAIQIIKGSHSTETFKKGALCISEDEYDEACMKADHLMAIYRTYNNPTVFRRDIVLAFYRVFPEIKNFSKFLDNFKNFVQPQNERSRDWIAAYKAILFQKEHKAGFMS